MEKAEVLELQWIHPGHVITTSHGLCPTHRSQLKKLKPKFRNRRPHTPPPEINLVRWNENTNTPFFDETGQVCRLVTPGKDKKGKYVKRVLDVPLEENVKKSKREHNVKSKKEAKLNENISSHSQVGLERTKVRLGKRLGWGVKATKTFEKGDFVSTYKGVLLNKRQAFERREYYTRNKLGNFLYEFYYNETLYVIDATDNDYSLGRFINHSKYDYNLITKSREIAGKLFLYFVAAETITPGTQIVYNYDDRDHYPEDGWLDQ